MHSAFTHYSLQDPVSTNHTTRANRLLSPIVLHRRPRRRAVQQTGLRCTPTQHSRSAYNASLCLRENAAGILRCAAVAETRPQNFIAISDLPPLDPAAVPNVKRSEPNALLSPQHPRFREPEQVTNASRPDGERQTDLFASHITDLRLRDQQESMHGLLYRRE